MTENELSSIIVDSAIEVHRTLGGPGLLESVYEEALVYELEQRGLGVERQKVVPLVYKGKRLAAELRVDLLIEGSWSSLSAKRPGRTTRFSRPRF